MTGNEAQRAFWTEMAPTWIALGDHVARVGGRFGQAAIDRLAPVPGERVLDVGCGAGATTLALAERVSPGGAAVGVDLSAPLVAEARARAEAAGVTAASFLEADAQVDDLGAAGFDAAFSQFGVMFFADPVAAFANVHRSLVPGGRPAFACWQDVGRNEWMLVPAMAMVSALGAPPAMPGPDAPGPFSLAAPDRVRAVLSGAGFADVEIAAHDDPLQLAEAELEAFASFTLEAGAAREALREHPDRASVARAVLAALRERAEGGTVTLGAAAWIVHARA